MEALPKTLLIYTPMVSPKEKLFAIFPTRKRNVLYLSIYIYLAYCALCNFFFIIYNLESIF